MRIILLLILIFIPITIFAECLSDFNCGIGYKCVKEPFKTRGICMKTVDEYGIPQYNLPDLDSVYPRLKGDCDYDLDCPIGFYCHKKFKVCIKR